MTRRYGLIALVLILSCAAGLRDGLDEMIDATELPDVLIETSIEVHDRNGALMRVYPVEDGRVRLSLQPADVDPDFISMLIAYEDKRFYEHQGVDPRALLRAGFQALWRGEVVSGGSTLTMQVARLLENSGTGRWHGKLRQMRLALALERQLSKDQILTLYLAHAPYGGRVEGLRAGTLAWFGKEPKRLTIAEAALLIALPQAPETRRPDRHLETALAARSRVLARVHAPEQARLAAVPSKMKNFPQFAPHLADHLRKMQPEDDRLKLTIDKTIQTQMRTMALRAVQGQAAGVSAAIIVADHHTGEVLASVGSPAYSDKGGALGFVDMTRAVRSPGSTLKPLIYAIAIDQGLVHPETLVNDAPVAFGRYAPQNFDGHFRGELTVREALQLSLNIPPVLLTEEIGPARLMATLRKAGTRPELSGGKPGLAVALGGVGMTLNDLVQLYAALANGGEARPLKWQPAEDVQGRRIISEVAAWQVANVLSGIAPPAGSAARGGQIAYKTGTSYGHRDAWAVGFDGQHVIGVWLGRPDGTPVPGAFGGALAAPVLFEAFGRLAPQRHPLPPAPPDTLTLSTSDLPAPLRRFRSREAVFRSETDPPVVSFPPSGAILRKTSDGIPLKVRAGKLPLTVLINGAPVLTGLTRRETFLPLAGTGYSRISVIDARGQGTEVSIQLD